MPAQNKKEFIVFHFSRLCRYYLRLAIGGVDEDRRVCGNALAISIVPLKAVKRRYYFLRLFLFLARLEIEDFFEFRERKNIATLQECNKLHTTGIITTLLPPPTSTSHFQPFIETNTSSSSTSPILDYNNLI